MQEPDSAARYVCVHMSWHIRNAIESSDVPRQLAPERSTADDVLERLIAHNAGCAFQVISALGVDHVDRLREAAEARGDSAVAGGYCYAAAILYSQGSPQIKGLQSLDKAGEEYVRGLRLLAQVDDATKGRQAIFNELVMCISGAQCGLTRTGIFADDELIEFIRQRRGQLTERRRQIEGDTFAFKRDEIKPALADLIQEFYLFFYSIEDDEDISDEAISKLLISVLSLMRARLVLWDSARTSEELCYAVCAAGLWMEFLLSGCPRDVVASVCQKMGYVNEQRGEETAAELGRRLHFELVAEWGGQEKLLAGIQGYNQQHYTMQMEGDIGDFFLIGPFGFIGFTWGQVGALSDLLDQRIAEQRKLEEMNKAGLAISTKNLEALHSFIYHYHGYIKCGMRVLAERALTLVHIDSWEASETFFDDAWPAVAKLLEQPQIGGEQYFRWLHVLSDFLVLRDAPERARAIVCDNEAKVLELDTKSKINLFAIGTTSMSLAEVAGLAAEVLTEDDVATRYARHLIQRYKNYNNASRISGRLILARIEQRRRGRPASLKLWEQAAAEALDSMQPLYALHVGCECGDDEGAAVIERAMAVIGRPRDDLLEEYFDACGIEA